MKSNRRKPQAKSVKKPDRISDKNDNELIVIRDPYTRKEYYLSMIDTFVLNKN